MDKAVERFECTISRHDWRNGRQTFNLHIEGGGMSQQEFNKMLENIVAKLPELREDR